MCLHQLITLIEESPITLLPVIYLFVKANAFGKIIVDVDFFFCCGPSQVVEKSSLFDSTLNQSKYENTANN